MQYTSVTHDEYIFGDFDGDGIKNIDDTYPFNKEISVPVNPELNLSDEILALKTYRNLYYPVIDTIVKNLQLSMKIPLDHISYRVKNEISIINKLRKKHLSNIKDVGGIRIVFDTYDDLNRVGSMISSHYNLYTKNLKQKNFYTNPKKTNPCYRGVHYTFDFLGMNIELQLQTKRINKLVNEFHYIYKKNPDIHGKEYDTFCRLMNIANRADHGNKTFQKQWSFFSEKLTKDFFSHPDNHIYDFKRIDEI